jgi:iron(III) transport system substrate-binding protein
MSYRNVSIRKLSHRKPSRRDLIKASTALAVGTVFAQPLRAAAPAPSVVTPALIEAARKEGKLTFYSALELPVAERFGKLFEAKYPGISVRVERSGAERLFQRIGQEHRPRALSRLEAQRLAGALPA